MRGNVRGLLLHLSSSSPRSSSCSQVFLYSCNPGGDFWRRRAENFSSASSSSSSSSHTQWRHHDEESKSVRIAVWWDIENCCIPNGVNAFRVPHRITSALRAHGIRGPVSITAFGDITRLPRSTQDALCASGVCLNHVPNCGKNSSDRSLLADLVYWVAQNPPPVHFFLISGDGDFANILHRLRMNNYNILLSGGDATPGALCCAATIMWHWNSLAKGENLFGKHFNHPPDGSHGSWYGHFKGSLDNPFPETDQINVSQLEDAIEVNTESKPRTIPKALGNAIRRVLDSHPEGISVSELRSELTRNNIALEKDYFGHKKFSHLLLSMPNILKFRFSHGDPQPLVHGVHQRSATHSDPILKPNFGDGSGSLFLPQKTENKQLAAEESPLHKTTEGKVVASCKEDDKKSVESQSCTKNKESTESEAVFGGLLKKLSEESIDRTKITSNDVASESFSSFGKISSPPNNKENKENKLDSESDSKKDENTVKSGFFSRIFRWFRFRKASSRVSEEHQNDQHSVEGPLTLPIIQPEPHNLFLKSHFWDSMESFLGTSKGSDLISISRTREELMRGLQKEGPLVLTALKEGHLCQLVNLLIEEKKWLKESTESYPFKLMLQPKRSCIQSHSNRVNGLRSIFSDKNSRPSSDPTDGIKSPKGISEIKVWFNRTHETTDTPLSFKDYEKQFEGEFGKKLEPLSYGYFTVDDLMAACRVESEPDGYLKTSRADTLDDCKKLLVDFLQHHPHGFNIGLFRPMFFKRYGYVLDYQTLGYPKLASLLQIMPGVRIESSLVLPNEKKMLEESGVEGEEQNDEKEQSWEELGPLSEENKSIQVKNKSVSALLEVLDGYYSKPREESGKEEEGKATGKRKISFVSDLREEEGSASLLDSARKVGESRLKSKLDPLGT